MNGISRLGLALLCCAGIAGCAAPVANENRAVAAPAASQAIVAGQSSKADVIAALGATQTIRFDSGYEVWIYRYRDEKPGPLAQPASKEQLAAEKQSGNAPEFLVLFTPSGVVAKTRMRPAPAIHAGQGK
ncbi:MAG: hypothetical protein V4488_02125 [Pseudomonadota bacterium]